MLEQRSIHLTMLIWLDEVIHSCVENTVNLQMTELVFPYQFPVHVLAVDMAVADGIAVAIGTSLRSSFSPFSCGLSQESCAVG